jgi:hypothetical protein
MKATEDMSKAMVHASSAITNTATRLGTTAGKEAEKAYKRIYEKEEGKRLTEADLKALDKAIKDLDNSTGDLATDSNN